MDKRILLFSVLGFIVFAGCGVIEDATESGGGSGTPGSTGSDKTNVILSAQISGISNTTGLAIPLTVLYNCPSSDKAHVEITAMRWFKEIPAGLQTIEKYEIKYTAATEGAPPIAEYDSGFQTFHIDCTEGKCDDPKGPQLDFDAILLNLQRKNKYIEDIRSGIYRVTFDDVPEYVAKYRFFGKDQWGSPFSFPAQTTFTIGIGNCTGS